MKLPVLDGRCTGACCRRMVISKAGDVWTREQIEKGATDGIFIADMLLPIQGPQQEGGAEPGTVFTCRHFDGHNCTVYEMRPRMCRAHGREDECLNPGCTLPPPTDICRQQMKWWWRQRHKDYVRKWLHDMITYIRAKEATLRASE